MTALLAIDPGTATGVAFCRPDGTVVFRTWKLDGIGGGRLVQFEDLLNALHSVEQFGRVSYEEPFWSPHTPTAARPLERLAGIIESWCARRGSPCWAYTVGEIKRAVADGRADKRRMIERVRALGYPVTNDHEADAVAQLLLLMRGATPKARANRTAANAAKRAASVCPECPHARTLSRAWGYIRGCAWGETAWGRLGDVCLG